MAGRDKGAAFMHFAQEGERRCARNEREAAIPCFLAALKVGTDDLQALSVVNSQLGTCYYYLGDYTQAARYHEADVAIAKQMKDVLGAAMAYANLGNTYKSMGRFDGAVSCYKNQLTLGKAINNAQVECRALGNLGSALLALGGSLIETDEPRGRAALNEALEHLLQNMQLAEAQRNADALGKAYGNIGTVYDHLQSFDRACKYHRSALNSHRPSVTVQPRVDRGATWVTHTVPRARSRRPSSATSRTWRCVWS